jgi:Na+/proline symporter
LCAIFAATLSTVDSLILAAGATIAEDIYKPLFQQKHNDKNLLWISHLGSLVTALIALAIAWQNNESIYNLVIYAWSGLGSSFGPLVISLLYSNKITKQGALAGIISGGLMSALWPYQSPLVPGFFFGLIVIHAVSRLTYQK